MGPLCRRVFQIASDTTTTRKPIATISPVGTPAPPQLAGVAPPPGVVEPPPLPRPPALREVVLRVVRAAGFFAALLAFGAALGLVPDAAEPAFAARGLAAPLLRGLAAPVLRLAVDREPELPLVPRDAAA